MFCCFTHGFSLWWGDPLVQRNLLYLKPTGRCSGVRNGKLGPVLPCKGGRQSVVPQVNAGSRWGLLSPASRTNPRRQVTMRPRNFVTAPTIFTMVLWWGLPHVYVYTTMLLSYCSLNRITRNGEVLRNRFVGSKNEKILSRGHTKLP